MYISPNPILQASGLQEKDKTWLRLYLALLKGSRSPYPFLISQIESELIKRESKIQ